MRGEFTVNVSTIYGFLLVLARIAGTMIFVPLPVFKGTMDNVRIVLILAITMALYPVWPRISGNTNAIELAGLLAIEAAFGLAVGLLVGFLSDATMLFGQICGLQAGFSYASTVDPDSQADSPVLSTLAQMLGSLLFVTFGLHRYVLQVFAESLESQPPGTLQMNRHWGELVAHAAGSLFTVGMRLALPIVGLMLMVDLTLALVGRVNAQLQLLHLAMPLKIMAALATIAVLLMLFPSVYGQLAEHMFRTANLLMR